MGLDARFITAPDLQTYFVDKLTGLPLSNGYIKFWKDQSRNIPKNVYTISGTPPNYIYTSIGSTVNLSSVGTPNYLGQDIIIYFFPFDGDPSNSSLSQELYYIEVFDSDDNPQFTREGWPNDSVSDTSVSNINNYIPNGQLLLHTNIAPTSNTPIGRITQPITTLGQGGFTFERPAGSSSIDNVTFERLTPVTNPSANPRYMVRIVNTIPNSLDTFKDFRIKFKDVNKFSSTNKYYTFFFVGQSQSASSFNVGIYLIKNFGTGGDPQTETLINTIVLNTSYPSIPFSIPLIFGTNIGKTLGINNDDFLQIAIRFPTSSSFNCLIGDFGLTDNNVQVNEFPAIPNNKFVYESTSGWLDVPNYEGNDYYLPILNTAEGQVVDYSRVGSVFSALYTSTYSITNNFPVRLCDGSSYVYSESSILRIPNRRLGDFLIKDSPLPNTPKFGTGDDYATAYQNYGNSSILRLTVNSSGTPISNATDGSTSWVFSNVTTGINSINYDCYNFNASNSILCILNSLNVLGNPSAGTSGFTIGFPSPLTTFKYFSFSIETIAASLLANPLNPARYMVFYNSTTQYYIWFQITTETDPAPGGTGIKVLLKSTDTAQDVANVLRETINCFLITNITITGLPLPGQYWLFQTKPGFFNRNFYVWYKVDGVGADPLVSGRIGILVEVLSTDNTSQVMTKTLSSINRYQYKVPDFRGMFLRGLENNVKWDADLLTRFSTITGISGANIGTFEFQQFLSHKHDAITGGTPGYLSQGSTIIREGGGPFEANANPLTAIQVNIQSAGGNETRPINSAVNWYIYY